MYKCSLIPTLISEEENTVSFEMPNFIEENSMFFDKAFFFLSSIVSIYFVFITTMG